MTPELNGYNLDKDLFTRWEAWEPHTKTRSYIRTLLRCRWIPKTRFPVQAHRQVHGPPEHRKYVFEELQACSKIDSVFSWIVLMERI